MKHWHLLAVDDEPMNLEIIEGILEDPRIALDLALNGESAWERLETDSKPYDIVILDRMMPGMNGIELLRRMKADDRFRRIPVIFQTAAAAPEEVREGIEAGAYYYLTKPYDPAALLAIVRAAMVDVDNQASAVERTRHQADTLRLLDAGEFHFANLDEANRLAALLASLCPVPEAAAMGLTEIMINAIEHGNLGISYEDKSRLRREEGWEAEVQRRLALPENSRKKARVVVRRAGGEIEFSIRDEGPGFDWQRYLAFDPARAFDPNGRGIAMASAISFSRIQYVGAGNEVLVAVKLQ